MVKELLGEQNAQKLKEMRESGASPESLANEVDRMVGELTDEAKKTKAMELGPYCKKIFGVQQSSRRRRDHHQHYGHEGHHGEHSMDDYFRTHLAWLSDSQKQELKTMKDEGKSRDEIQQKVRKIQ